MISAEMHETGIAAELLRMAGEQCATQGGKSVSRVGVRVGAMSGVVGEALAFAFEALRGEDPLVAGAELEIEYVPLRARCARCGEEAEAGEDLVLWCARCGAALDIMQGRELDLMWVELERREASSCNESP